jgi:hypothetical protein
MAKRKKSGQRLLARRGGVLRASGPLLDDVRKMIRQARTAVAQAVNAALALLYWQIGKRIRTEVLKEKRAYYGAEICSTLSGIRVASYLTELPPRRLLQRKLHEALLFARARLEAE